MNRPVHILLAALLSGSASQSTAQQITGNLEGRIIGRSGEAIAGAAVTVHGLAIAPARVGLTDARGFFHFHALAVGEYSVTMRRLGYRTVIYTNVMVELGRTVTLGEVELELQPVELEPLLIRNTAALLDMASTTYGVHLERRQYDLLPVDRDYSSLLSLIPHALPSYLGDGTNAAGSTGIENTFFIDGVNVTDPHQGVRNTRLPHNFVRAVEFKTGGYEAEFGRSLGAIVNVITHSGGDRFQSNAFLFTANDALSGSSLPGPAEIRVDEFSNYDLGFSLGGPLKRERLAFFGAYNADFAIEQVEIPGLGRHSDRRTTHMFAGKLTWTPSARADVLLTVFGDPATEDNVRRFNNLASGGPARLLNADGALGRASQGGFSVSLNSTFRFTPKLLISGSVSRLTQEFTELGRTKAGRLEPAFTNLAKERSGGYGQATEHQAARTAAGLSSTLLAGPHSIKIGTAYEDNLVHNSLIFTRPGLVTQQGPQSFLSVYLNHVGDVRNRVLSMFVQDSWTATRRLVMNAGLRWDGQYLMNYRGDLIQPFDNQLQPRVGLVFQPGAIGASKLTGSYGRFYEQMPLHLSTIMHTVWEGATTFYSADPRQQPDAVIRRIDFGGTEERATTTARGARGTHFDEFTIGYERLILDGARVSLRGVYRELREVFDVGVVASDNRLVARTGNPGRGVLSELPRPTRNYRALEATLQSSVRTNPNFLVSYVWSRNFGNYPGLYGSDQRAVNPNFNLSLQLPEQAVNSTGLLPNDRTHAAKLQVAHRFDFGLTAGLIASWLTGTPLSTLGTATQPPRTIFLTPRGSEGRTPSIWDLNFRFGYDLSAPARPARARLMLDLLHVGSRKQAVDFDQLRYRAVDQAGRQINPNPTFGIVLRYQPPMQARLGLDLALQ